MDLSRKKGGIMKSKYDFEEAVEELLDEALNTLSPDSFRGLLDSISMILVNYEE